MAKESTIRLSRKLQGIAKALDKKIEQVSGERIAFTLIVFTEGRASYVSTCNRKESVENIKHLLDLWEKQMPDVPAHDVQ